MGRIPDGSEWCSWWQFFFFFSFHMSLLSYSLLRFCFMLHWSLVSGFCESLLTWSTIIKSLVGRGQARVQGTLGNAKNLENGDVLAIVKVTYCVVGMLRQIDPLWTLWSKSVSSSISRALTPSKDGNLIKSLCLKIRPRFTPQSLIVPLLMNSECCVVKRSPLLPH